MRSVWHPRTKVGAARLVGLLAVILTLATIALWTLRFLVLLPPTEHAVTDKLVAALTADALFALLAPLGVLLPRWTLFSALLLVIACVGS
jgi:hypothetical protein